MGRKTEAEKKKLARMVRLTREWPHARAERARAIEKEFGRLSMETREVRAKMEREKARKFHEQFSSMKGRKK